MNEYIEFKVNDLARFKLLQNIFQKIKADKDNDSFQEDKTYLQFFDEKAKSYFGWYSDKEIKEWSEKWFSTPVESRWTNRELKMKWIFGSMIDSFKNSEYELLSCKMISIDKARMTYKPFAFPYGGNGLYASLN